MSRFLKKSHDEIVFTQQQMAEAFKQYLENKNFKIGDGEMYMQIAMDADHKIQTCTVYYPKPKKKKGR